MAEDEVYIERDLDERWLTICREVNAGFSGELQWGNMILHLDQATLLRLVHNAPMHDEPIKPRPE